MSLIEFWELAGSLGFTELLTEAPRSAEEKDRVLLQKVWGPNSEL